MIEFFDDRHTIIRLEDICGCSVDYMCNGEIFLYMNQEYQEPLVLEYSGDINACKDDYLRLGTRLVSLEVLV